MAPSWPGRNVRGARRQQPLAGQALASKVSYLAQLRTDPTGQEGTIAWRTASVGNLAETGRLPIQVGRQHSAPYRSLDAVPWSRRSTPGTWRARLELRALRWAAGCCLKASGDITRCVAGQPLVGLAVALEAQGRPGIALVAAAQP